MFQSRKTRCRKKIIAVLSVVACAIAFSVSAFAANYVKLSENFYVTDNANILSLDTVSHIEEINANLEQNANGAQICIVTVEYCDGRDIADYTVDTFNQAEIGDKSAGNGALLLLATKQPFKDTYGDYYMAIGTGLEKSMSGSAVSDFLTDTLEDDFVAEKYNEGVIKTVDAMSDRLMKMYGTGSASEESLSTGDRLALKAIEIWNNHALSSSGVSSSVYERTRAVENFITPLVWLVIAIVLISQLRFVVFLLFPNRRKYYVDDYGYYWSRNAYRRHYRHNPPSSFMHRGSPPPSASYYPGFESSRGGLGGSSRSGGGRSSSSRRSHSSGARHSGGGGHSRGGGGRR